MIHRYGGAAYGAPDEDDEEYDDVNIAAPVDTAYTQPQNTNEPDFDC